jgi:hypothetical protein
MLTHLFHDLQLTILVPTILKHFLYRYRFSRFSDSRLVYDTERSVINHSISVICEISPLFLSVFAHISLLGRFRRTAAARAVAADVVDSGYMVFCGWAVARLSRWFHLTNKFCFLNKLSMDLNFKRSGTPDRLHMLEPGDSLSSRYFNPQPSTFQKPRNVFDRLYSESSIRRNNLEIKQKSRDAPTAKRPSSRGTEPIELSLLRRHKEQQTRMNMMRAKYQA